MPKTYTRVLIDMLAPDLMSPTAIIETDSFEDTRPVAFCKKGREQAAEAAKLQAQAAQQQASIAQQQLPISQQQMALAQREEQQAEADQAAKTGLINKNLGYMEGLQPELDQLKSKPGSLTPAAQAQYQGDIENINSVYKNAQQAGFAQLAGRGMNGAPQGTTSSMINSNNAQRAAAQTQSYRTGQQNTQSQNLQALQGEMNLANMKNSLIGAYNPQGDLSLANGSLSGGSNTLSGASSGYSGSANSAGGEANTAGIMNSMGSPVGNILGAIGSVAAAPFTGGTSLAGMGFNALKPLFTPKPSASGSGTFAG